MNFISKLSIEYFRPIISATTGNDGGAAAGPHPLHAQSNDMANKHIRYASNGLG